MLLLDYLSFFASPLLFLLFVVYLRFKFELKSLKFIWQALLWGFIAVIFVIAANEIIKVWGLDNLRNMRRTAFYVFVVVAFSAEFGKFIPLRYSFYNLKHFNTPLSGIIYGMIIALGFSTLAVVLYAFGILGTEKMKYMTLFLWTYPLANLVFGAVQGFFIGMGKVRKNTLFDELSCLGIATFFHALFYFGFLTSDQRLLLISGIGLAIVGIVLVVKASAIKPVSR